MATRSTRQVKTYSLGKGNIVKLFGTGKPVMLTHVSRGTTYIRIGKRWFRNDSYARDNRGKKITFKSAYVYWFNGNDEFPEGLYLDNEEGFPVYIQNGKLTSKQPNTTIVREEEGPSIPSSAIRHRPIVFNQALVPVKVEANPKPRHHPAVYISIGVALVCMVLLLALGFIAVWGWWQNLQNIRRYSLTPTTVTKCVVGLGQDSKAHPSIFILMNIEGLITLEERPGGQIEHAKIQKVGLLMPGNNPDQASQAIPTLDCQDVNGDGHPDLLVLINGVQYATYLNENGTFVLQN